MATICVAATQKQQKNIGCFGTTITKKGSRKPQELSGVFRSTGRIECQLKALIHSINLISDMDEIHIYSDSIVIENFLDGTVSTWELVDWSKENGKPIENALLWQELNGLVEAYDIEFHKPKSKKEMSAANKLLTSAKEKPEVCMELNLGRLSELDEFKGDLTQEEADILVEKNLPKSTKKETIKKVASKKETAKKEVSKKESKVSSKKVEKKPVKKEVIEKKEMPKEKATISVTAEKVSVAAPSNTGLTISVDEKTLAEYDAFFQELGIDTETAVKLFLKQSLRTQSIPFNLALK